MVDEVRGQGGRHPGRHSCHDIRGDVRPVHLPHVHSGGHLADSGWRSHHRCRGPFLLHVHRFNSAVRHPGGIQTSMAKDSSVHSAGHPTSRYVHRSHHPHRQRHDCRNWNPLRHADRWQEGESSRHDSGCARRHRARREEHHGGRRLADQPLSGAGHAKKLREGVIEDENALETHGCRVNA